MADLIETLKEQIIAQLNLEDVSPEEINPDEPLFGGDLGLDSIDALELIVLLERDYGIKIKSQEEGQNVFVSVRSMADFIKTHQAA